MTVTPCGSCTAPVADQAMLCTGCTGKLAGALKLAVSIAPDLDDAVARLLRRGGGGKSASPEPPLPFDLAASEASARLRAELVLWACRVPPGASAPLTTVQAAALLLERLGALRQHPQAGDAHKRILAAVDRALAVIDRKPEMVPVGPCPTCGRHLLAELGADNVGCECGHWESGLIARHRERARKADKLLTPVELSAALAACGYTVAPGTISSWGTRGLIERRAGGYYRLSDAIDRAARVRGVSS